MEFKAIFWKEKKWILGKVLGFEGALAQTKTLEETKEVLEDIIIDFIHVKIKNGNSIKQEVTFDDLVKITEKYKNKNSIVGFISVDSKKVDPEFFRKERTNLSVIKGYKQMAKNKGVNLSKFLNKSLEKKFG